MSIKQLQEWMLFAELEPFGPERADVRAGAVAAATYNVHRDTTKHPEPFASADCVPTFGDMPQSTVVKPKRDWRIMKAFAEAMCQSNNDRLVKTGA